MCISVVVFSFNSIVGIRLLVLYDGICFVWVVCVCCWCFCFLFAFVRFSFCKYVLLKLYFTRGYKKGSLIHWC